jgi:hypothetical protein
MPRLGFILLTATALAFAGCATQANLSPTSRIVLFCNPVGHAVDLALGGLAAAVTVHSYGLVGLDWSDGRVHQRGEWSIPGVMCVDGILDQVDAAENSPPRSTKGD